MSAQAKPFYTPEQYVKMERRAGFKSEYVSGQIFAMAGGSPRHSAIGANLLREIGSRLKGKPCQTYTSDLRVTIVGTGLKTYPDVTVVCGQQDFHSHDEDSLTNPTVLIEVLSPATEAYDRGAKWANYQRLESLQEYILVSQDQARVEQYVRQSDGSWKFTMTEGQGGNMTLSSLAITLPLTEVYDRITFVEATTGEETTHAVRP